MTRLDDKVAFITGAGAGIGRAAAILFSRAGAKIVVADIDDAAGRECVAEVEKQGGRALFVHTDVGEPENVEFSMTQAVEMFGRIDVLYNNAGGSTPADGTVLVAPIEEFWRAIKRDLFGTWVCCRFAIPHMIRAGGGAIINTASMLALVGTRNRDCYTAAKGGVVAITRSMAVEFAPQRIRVNAVSPGITRSDRIRRRQETGDIQQSLIDSHLLGFAEPEDVAHAALYLASDEARVTTGQILSVDSGMTIS